MSENNEFNQLNQLRSPNNDRRHYHIQQGYNQLVPPYAVQGNYSDAMQRFSGIHSSRNPDPDMFLRTGFDIQITDAVPTKHIGIYTFYAGKYGYEPNVHVKKAKASPENQILVARDIRITQSLNPSKVVPRFLNVATTSDFFAVALENFGMSFAAYIKNQEGVAPSEGTHDLFFDTSFDLLNGLSYLHEKGIVHCDIQPDNIYYQRNPTSGVMETKIGGLTYASYTDFVATNGGEHKRILAAKSWKWKVPEWTDKNTYGQLSDVYSLGCIFFVLMFGDHLRIPW